MAMSSPLHVLVIDDDPDAQANLRDILELDDYQVATAGSAAETLARTDWSVFTAIMLDRKLPDSSAEELLPRLRQLAPAAAIMIVTGYTDLQGAIAAIRLGAADYITKPIDPDLVRSRLARVAEQRRAAEEIARLNNDLQHRVNELQTLLDVIPIGIAITQDTDCRTIRVNPALAKMLDIAPGANASLSAPAGERPAFKVSRNGRDLAVWELPMHRAATQGGVVQNEEFDIVHPDGGVVHLVGSSSPLVNEQGQPRGAVGAFLDITERKQAQERALQTERLAAIGQMMTGLAHESGNALARSQACLEMLQWEVQDRPEALELINRVQKAQDHLRQLYEEVRGYAAPLKLERGVWNLGGIWRQAWDNLYVQRENRDASLREDVDGVDLHCAVDQFRLEQVFRNILENALAACADPVRIVVRGAEAEIVGHPAVRLSIQDNGPGLTPEQQQRIFEPFFTTKTKGTGLGMAIAKRIVEAHGGQIGVGRGLGGGAEILLTLPREPL